LSRTLYFTISTAGHVDHGKTSVLRALTGIDPDRLKEEKLRQMTTDLGFAHLNLPNALPDTEFVVGFVDVPGHGKFLKNMLAGVGGIDMALLVVAADEGPMPQTIAHVKILSLLGVRKALVVLTKVDVAGEPMQQQALKRIDELLQRYSVEKIGVVPVACPTQKGFEELKQKLRDVLAAGAVQRHTGIDKEPVYLPIDRVFSKSGYGMVITGTLVRGTVNVGDSLFVEPGGLKPRVRGLETFGHQLQTATAGQRLAINLTFREHTSLARGQTILGEMLQPANTLLVQFDKTPDGDDKNLEKTLPGQPIRLYHGTSECPGDVRWVETVKADGAGEQLLGQIGLAEAVVAEPGDRFVVRHGDEGITGGVILFNSRPRWLTRPKLLELSAALLSRQYKKAVAQFLDACPQRTVRQEAVYSLLPRSIRNSIIEELISEATTIRLTTHLVTKESMQVLTTKLAKEIAREAATADDTSKQGSMERMRAKVLPGVERTVFQALIKELSDTGKIIRKGDQLTLPDLAAAAAARDKPQARSELENKVMMILCQHLCLEIEELAKQLNVDKKQVTKAIHDLAKDHKAAIVNYEFASTYEKIQFAHNKLVEVWDSKKEITPADFRDAVETTRKYAMALLAYFDDNGITRRTTTSRALLKKPKAD
jgi:selenocysteine-specific elongation factor